MTHEASKNMKERHDNDRNTWFTIVLNENLIKLWSTSRLINRF